MSVVSVMSLMLGTDCPELRPQSNPVNCNAIIQ